MKPWTPKHREYKKLQPQKTANEPQIINFKATYLTEENFSTKLSFFSDEMGFELEKIVMDVKLIGGGYESGDTNNVVIIKDIELSKFDTSINVTVGKDWSINSFGNTDSIIKYCSPSGIQKGILAPSNCSKVQFPQPGFVIAQGKIYVK